MSLSPFEWLTVLSARLDERWQRIELFDAYYRGDHRVGFNRVKEREAFGALFTSPVSNWCPLVVESSVERLKVQGFRFGATKNADDDAWAIWQANGLDAEANMAHTEAVKLSEAYWLVEPPLAAGDAPRITAEHPAQVIVATAPGNRRQRSAALKRWAEGGYLYATVYLPDVIAKFRTRKPVKDQYPVEWVSRPDDPGGANVMGEVPVVPLRNSPSLLHGGRSDLEPVVPVQDAINKLLSDGMVSSEFQAYPQRVLIGVEVPKTEEEQRLAKLRASQSRLWMFEGNASVDEFSPADLSNQSNFAQFWAHQMCAQTRTPPHYVMGEIINASGDALKAAETGLVSKVRDKMVSFGEAHEAAMRLAFKAIGDTTRASAQDAETIWRDPETRSFGELIDGLVKLASIGVPQEILWEKAGFSPQDIDRMKSLQVADALIMPDLPAPEPQPVMADGSAPVGGTGAS